MSNVKCKEKKIKAQAIEVSMLPGNVETSYTLQFGNDSVNVFVVSTTGKRIAGINGLLGEISAQATTSNIVVKSNGKSWTIPEGCIIVTKGDVTKRALHCYGGKLTTKKLLDVITNYEAAKAYYTFFDYDNETHSNIGMEEQIFTWMEAYASEVKIGIEYIISAVLAHDKAITKYAKKFMKELRKNGTKISDLEEGVEELKAQLADLICDDDVILEG